MAADAFPAPTTIVRPFGLGGKFCGTHCSGMAAATAASNMDRKNKRVASGVMESTLLVLSNLMIGQQFKRLH